MANPYYLMLKLDHETIESIELPDGGPKLQPPPRVLKVDLDEHGWLETYRAELFESGGEWHLVRKGDDHVVFSMRVWPGEQPYYTARVIGTVGYGEVRAYSIGKKTRRQRKGVWHDNEDNLWILPWGQVCGGTDVEYFATQGLKKGLHRV